MAKVLPISGVCSPELLGFALGKARAMEAGHIGFSKEIRTDSGLLVFRQDADGRVTAFVHSGAAYVSVFSNIQFPEAVTATSKMPDVATAKLLIGTFPETVLNPSWLSPSRQGKTQFGTSPFSKKNLRLSQRVVRQGLSDVPSLRLRWGVNAGSTVSHTVFSDAAAVEVVDLKSPVGSYTDVYNFMANGRSTEFIPVLTNSDRAVIGTVDADALATSALDVVSLPYEGGSPGGGVHGVQTIEQSGSSWIKLRILSNKKNPAGIVEPGYRRVDVAPLPYANSYRKEYGTSNNLGEFVTEVPTASSNRTEINVSVTNDVERTFPHRRWHAQERVSVSPQGAAFVLRETNFQTVSSMAISPPITGVVNTSQTSSAVRGLSLSFVSPADLVMNHVYTRGLGQHGYIENVIPSADGKRCFIYYGLHDDSEAQPDPADAYPFMPLRFNEYLDVISVAGGGGNYTFVKAATISLGPVTLRALPIEGAKNQTDHYASKLHGAALEVAGFIWADRFCYDVAANSFMAIPNYVQYMVRLLIPAIDKSRDTTTGADDNRSSYLSVAMNGRSATYYLIKYGLVIRYLLVTDPITQVAELREDERFSVAGGYSDDENFSAESVRFQKPALIR